MPSVERGRDGGRDGRKRERGKERGMKEGEREGGGKMERERERGSERRRVEGRREGERERERRVEAFACLICTVCTYMLFPWKQHIINKFSQQLDEATGNTVRRNASKGRQVLQCCQPGVN